ncbi:hypothetical protein C8F04DRAFT_1277805 [Mycena alexandri]|uniref:DNA-directed DNA polymerase n=1 Tax=Mycena alexandri TaxID=1745969 RepID=A0AAD6S030_9AGAR|nr:hypothetical protein C8F04DRAFT_1277805 [Mycena alexandri]
MSTAASHYRSPFRQMKNKLPSERPTKRRKMSDSDSSSEIASPTPQIPISGVVKLYLVQAKLTAQNISELFSLAETHNLRVSKSQNRATDPEIQLALCSNPEESDIVVTNVHMRQRLERHIDWNLAKEKAIVTPEWLRDSVRQRTILPCGDYAALRELKKTTVEHCPDSDYDADSDQGTGGASPSARSESEEHVELTKAHYTSRYACLRPCPLVCPNQQLVQQLGIIRRSRELEGKDVNALSYDRTISLLKAYPYRLTSSKLPEVSTLPGIGEKMISKISEYVKHGRIRESETIAASARFKSLSEFTTIYGIGASTARKLFDTFGLRTMADLEEHYASRPASPTHHQRGERKLNTPAPVLSIPAALELRTDLDEKIPRAEVGLMHDIVMAELGKLRSGCLSTIVGGYRRGKAESNDVDIVITHPTLVSGSDQVKGLGELLVNRLYERGLITHVMHLSGFQPANALRTSHWDTLEKALTVFILPPDNSRSRRIHRRLDLIFAAPEAYWTAITGWTGSKMFERDLRLWAKVERGLKFDSTGITRRRDSKPYFPRSEKEVFDLLGLEWIDPTMRNADV